MLANRVVLGVEADVSVSSFLNYFGNRIGNTVPVLGALRAIVTTYSLPARCGPHRLCARELALYATGGFAWTSENYLLAPSTDSSSSNERAGRRGGVEGPLLPHWTVKAEYLYTSYGDNRPVNFLTSAQQFTSNLSSRRSRRLNYHFGEKDPPPLTVLLPIRIGSTFTAQATYTWQGYPAFRNPPGSLVIASPPFLGFPGGGQARGIGELRFMRACGYGRALNSGLIRRLIKASGLVTV